MVYRKYRADQLFDGDTLHETGQVLITNEEGVVEDIVSPAEAGDDVQVLQGILSPGFINCHCHLELSHMRGLIPEGTGLSKFVVQVVQQRHFAEEIILEAIANAENEMLNNGIVAVGDICNNTLTLSQKRQGRVYYHNFIEASGFNPAIAQQRFDRSVEFFRAYGGSYAIPVESNSIVPHAPYSVADELWEKIIHFPGNHLLTIHNQETAGEDEWFRNGRGDLATMYAAMKLDTAFFKPSGKSSLQTYLPKLLHNQSLIFVHNVYTTAEDIRFVQQTANGNKRYWCFCPNANQYISRQLPPVDLFREEDAGIVLGTDSLASNHQLSILSEMKTIRDHFPGIETGELLKWATSNGSKALQLDSLLGSFEKGKSPGIVLINEELTAVQRLA